MFTAVFVCNKAAREVFAASKADGDGADVPILFWLGKKSQLIAMGALSEAERIGATAGRIAAAAVAIQAKVDSLSAKIREKENDPLASEEDRRAAASARLSLSKVEESIARAAANANTLSSRLRGYSCRTSDFIDGMDACLSSLIASTDDAKEYWRS
jgi:hypothetical protein